MRILVLVVCLVYAALLAAEARSVASKGIAKQQRGPPYASCPGWPIGFPLTCGKNGACPDFNHLNVASAGTALKLLGFDQSAPDQIYKTWPQSYLHCLYNYCNATTGSHAGNPVCWPLLAARATRDAKQIQQAVQIYTNILCQSITDCTPWKILLTPTGDIWNAQPKVLGLPTPFSPNVVMRINPLGVFDKNLTMHYFYGLGQPAQPKDVTPESNRFLFLTYTAPFTAKNNIVTGQVDLTLVNFATGSVQGNFTHYFQFAFDDNYQVVSGEINFRHLGSDLDLPPSTPSAAVAAALCPKIQAVCTGAKQQYPSIAACQAYIGSLPIASWDKGNQANMPCVQLHQILINVFPDVHCPHVGPTGGDICTNVHNYLWDYTAVPSSYLSLASANY